jgi:tRNA(Ile)-lysidine synthase
MRGEIMAGVMPARTDPIRPDELDGLFASFFAMQPVERAGLAVSGGSDSTALMVLFADWLRQSGKPLGEITVLTVDHGLRPEAAVEARAVGERAGALGFRHAILAWDGPKPSTGVQAAARAARYRLMVEYARANAIALVLTGHTADDQAETLLMRLARGSGLDGLSAMAPLTDLAAPGDLHVPLLKLGRPLLSTPKARLRATLEARGIPWMEDPSNQHSAFERTRLRAAHRDLEALGLTTEMLALSARRLLRVRTAVERAVADFCSPGNGRVVIDPCGVIRIDQAALCSLPTEIAMRVLSWAIAAVGGLPEPVALANVETMTEAVCAASATGAWTLARAKILASGESVVLEREPGREALPVIVLRPGLQAMWDGRFLVTAGSRLSGVEVRALGVDGVRQVRAAVPLPPLVSPGALRALPGFWRAGRLIAAPHLAFWSEEAARGELSATFFALGNYNSGHTLTDAGSS